MVHNNVHVPKESFPRFLWYTIEFFIILGISVGISMSTLDYFAQMGFSEQRTNWIFWGIVGGIFLAYYIIIRPILFKKPVLSNI